MLRHVVRTVTTELLNGSSM